MEERRRLTNPNTFMSFPIQFNSDFPARARVMQKRLAEQVIREDRLPKKIHSVAGVDVAYAKTTSIGAASVLRYDSLTLMESQVSRQKTQFPYIPTLLSFREIPPAAAAIEKLKSQPDIFLVDGHGIAHPHRLGFASHLGLTIDKPTIGVAKRILCGKVEDTIEPGWSSIVDRGEVVGAAVATKSSKPVYVSVGHKVSIKRAVEIVKQCIRTHRIPEPVLAAHQRAAKEKRKHLKLT